MTFDAMWSATTHPLEFPSNPHFSTLVGGTHNQCVSFWEEGGLASEGIRQMAELGATGTFEAEVTASANASQVLLGTGSFNSPGSNSIEFDVAESYPLVTLVSMLAPSPDWFVGVTAHPLYVDDAWIDLEQVSLFAYDAGTDSGASYASPNAPTSPREPIAANTSPPFTAKQSLVPVGTFTFELLTGTEGEGEGTPGGEGEPDGEPQEGETEGEDPDDTFPAGCSCVEGTPLEGFVRFFLGDLITLALAMVALLTWHRMRRP